MISVYRCECLVFIVFECPVLIVFCLLFIVYCLLCIVYCLLFIVQGSEDDRRHGGYVFLELRVEGRGLRVEGLGLRA